MPTINTQKEAEKINKELRAKNLPELRPEVIAGEIIRVVLEEWAPKFVENRIEGAKEAGIERSRQLIKSMRAEIDERVGASAAQMEFYMESYGRILDMRRVAYRSRQMPQPAAAKWVREMERGGFHNFRPGYEAKYGKFTGTREELINRVAWGIAKTRLNTVRKRVHKRWYNKAKEGDISALYRLLLRALAENSIDVLKDVTEN